MDDWIIGRLTLAKCSLLRRVLFSYTDEPSWFKEIPIKVLCINYTATEANIMLLYNLMD